MALRAPHGAATKAGNPGPRVEVLPPDELPAPIGKPAHIIYPPRVGGRFAKGNQESKAGGAAKAALVSYGASLGLSKSELSKFPTVFQNQLRKAASYRRQRCAELSVVGGGIQSSGPRAMVASAAKQMAAGNYLLMLAGAEDDKELALKMFARAESFLNSARQNDAMAFELSVREGPVLLRAKPQKAAKFESDDDALARKKAEEEAAIDGEGVAAE